MQIIGLVLIGLCLLVIAWPYIKTIGGLSTTTTGQTIEKAVDYSQDIAVTIALKGALLHPAIKADAALVAAINEAIAAVWVTPPTIKPTV